MEKIITPLKNIITGFSKKGIVMLTAFSFVAHISFAREIEKPLSLGSIADFKSSFSKTAASEKKTSTIQLQHGKTVTLRVVNSDFTKKNIYLFGTVDGYEQATFFVRGTDKTLSGKVIFRKEMLAYDIYSDDNAQLFIKSVDIDEVICLDYVGYKDEMGQGYNDVPETTTATKGMETQVAPLLNSLPGSPNTLYLDFDGENVTGSNWGNINAAASSFSNAGITTIWTAVSEDYSPFNINVTTDRTVFNAAPTNKKMMVIFTPTNTAAPGAGGVAYLNSWGSGEPCWVFNNSVKSAFEAASHETGHTMGLSHDGRTTPQEEYFTGHGSWGPIMGAVYSRPIVQWSKGEYTAASNTQVDVTIISNKIAYRVDDAGNTPATAKPLVIGSGGSVANTANFGVIERQTDVDVFGFVTTGGTVSFTITAKTEAGSGSVPDLDIQVRILDAAGTQVATFNPTGVLTIAVIINQSLAAGTYYLEIDGVGALTPATTGYSDYGSLGQYFIAGTIPGGTSTGNGIYDNYTIHPIHVFPNPSSGVFSINIPMEGSNESSVEVLNYLGQPVMSSVESSTGNLFKQIDISGNAAGMYFISVRSGDNIWKGKVILK